MKQFYLFLQCVALTFAKSAKKGLGVGWNADEFKCGDEVHWNKVAWFYDWGGAPVNEIKCPGSPRPSAEFVPMQWGNSNYPSNVDASYWLGFNEPNLRAQSCIMPEQAADLWKRLEEIKAPHTKLVSPSAILCGGSVCCGGGAYEWFDRFFGECSNRGGCQVDAIATHHYPSSCNAQETMNYLKDLHERYGLPIWLTEFSCPHTHDTNKILDYMKAILPMLEAADYVQRYAWFDNRFSGDGFVTPATSLLHRDSSTPTALGEFFFSFMESEINWNGNDWAFACDFHNNDLSNAKTPGDQCGPTCSRTSGCTHFTWTRYEGGTCWMKKGAVTKDDAFSTGNDNMVCGVL